MITTKLTDVIKEFDKSYGIIYKDTSENTQRKGVNLIKNKKLQKYGVKTRELVETYGWDDVVAEFEEGLK